MLDSYFASFVAPPLSYIIFGAGGGLLYIGRQKLKGYFVKPAEYLVRPAFGAVAAYALTVTLGLPNHMTSLFAGYFGIDIWDALAARFNVPALGLHAPPPPPLPPQPPA